MLHNLQFPIPFFVKSIILDMHHRITYMYINFQQNRVCRSVITVSTNLFAKHRKLHKFATTNRHFQKIESFRHVSSQNVHVYQFSAKLG